MKKFTSIDEYISHTPQHTRPILETLRKAIHECVPNATETISYNIPAFQKHGNNLVHFATFAHHIGLYPTPSGINAFKTELKGYKQAKGSVQFPIGTPLPLRLIKRIVLFRAAEVR